MKRERILVLLLLAAGFVILPGCTSNPFGSNKISEGKRAMSGTVRLADQSNSKDIFVWMNGFKISTLTDENGEFTLNLPSQGGNGKVSGVFAVYFYMANYALDSAQVVVQNGEFLYSRGDLDKNGHVVSTKSLRRFLEINAEVAPATVEQDFNFRIGVVSRLRALVDSCTVIFPGSVGDLLGAVFFKNIATGEIVTFQSVPGSHIRDVAIVGRTITERVMAFELSQIILAPGQYEVIPQVLVRHQALPPGLIESIGPGVEEINPNYLKIPFRRTNGKFEVTP